MDYWEVIKKITFTALIKHYLCVCIEYIYKTLINICISSKPIGVFKKPYCLPISAVLAVQKFAFAFLTPLPRACACALGNGRLRQPRAAGGQTASP